MIKYFTRDRILVLSSICISIATFLSKSYFYKHLLQLFFFFVIFNIISNKMFKTAIVCTGINSLIYYFGNVALEKSVSLINSIGMFVFFFAFAYKIGSYNAMINENKVLKYKNSTDHLTRLYNRKYFDYCINKYYSQSISLLMIDIDHFKKVNDVYGHQCGDMILTEVANIIKNSIRDRDMAFRYGGEEFSAILISPKGKEYEIAERIKKSIEAGMFYYKGKTIKITASIGIANSFNAKGPDRLIRIADEALYRAKKEGRNLIIKAS